MLAAFVDQQLRDREAEKVESDASAAARIAEFCAQLRSIYYPKQAAYFRSRAKRRATRKTRRSGATTGGCRELLARAVEHRGFRATYVTTTRIEARARAWESDTQSGLVDLLRLYAKQLDQGGVTAFDVAGVTVEVRQQELALVFSNGSRIDLFGANDENALNKQRGLAKHVYWIDEAQDFKWLDRFYKAVIVGAMVDYKGECWLTGTPSRDCAGMFYEVTREDPQAAWRQWEVHSIAVVDNPFFGSTPEERWATTAAAALVDNGWTDDDPDFQREWLARWVKSDARFVYAANNVSDHQILYAPLRLDPNGFPDVAAALVDLPGRASGRSYFCALGCDLGTRAAFAMVGWAWSLEDPLLYELFSWAKTGYDYDDMSASIRAVMQQTHFTIAVADAGGGGKGAVQGWSTKWVDKYQLAITEAHKTNKHVAQSSWNADIRKLLCRFRIGSPLLQQMRSHRYRPIRNEHGKLEEDPGSPRDLCDAGLYAHRESYHFRHRPEELLPVPGTPAHFARQAADLESELDEEDDPYRRYGRN